MTSRRKEDIMSYESKAWKATHRIRLTSGETLDVMLDESAGGAAYTHAEWDAEVEADVEQRDQGIWYFQGDARGVYGVEILHKAHNIFHSPRPSQWTAKGAARR